MFGKDKALAWAVVNSLEVTAATAAAAAAAVGTAPRTGITSKGIDSVFRPTSKVLLPCLVGLDVRHTAPLHGRLGLAHHALAIKNEKGDDPILLEPVEIAGQVRFYAREAAESRQEGFVGRWVVEEQLQVVRRTNCDRAPAYGVKAMGPR